MFSLRTRVFVTVALVLAAATLASGLLSRRATLVEEREVFGPRRLPPLDGVGAEIQAAYSAGGWPATRTAMTAIGERLGTRLLALDPSNRPVAGLVGGARIGRRGLGNALMAGSRSGPAARARSRSWSCAACRRSRCAIPKGWRSGASTCCRADSGGPAIAAPFVPVWIASTARDRGGRAAAGVRVVGPDPASGQRADGRGAPHAPGRSRRPRRRRAATTRSRGWGARSTRWPSGWAIPSAPSDRWSSDVAHELRSPVTNLRCGLEAIQDGLVALDRERIDALHSETLLLQRLIADLQDLALADAGGLALDAAARGSRRDRPPRGRSRITMARPCE